ncbi:MAG: DUF1206 domain-containing protein [Austwickia sp.]|nr:DUF1206 domain-containing protein [Actinomycetota bacterium]MCB1252506.1 DUF1206 domain-containing protein [Austwickia sp.]MCO5310185.1 DUF1206 domain-containing protein [Austwickia sp.]
MTGSDFVDSAKDVARDTNDHPVVTAAARIGYAANGLIHLLIAWAALGIAWAPLAHGTADQSGALGGLAAQPWGRPLLWVLVAGLFGLGLWQLTEAVGGWHGSGREAVFSRLKAIGKAIAYAALGGTALTFARGGQSDSRSQSTDITATLLGSPGGRILVAVVGLATLGIGVYHVIKGWQKKFLRDLVADPGEVAEQAGRFGYIAKGIALAVAGLLFLTAALRSRPDEATGLDGALRALADTPYGFALLTIVALGLAAYGIYSFFRARYTKL